MENFKFTNIGSFQVTSGAVVVTDPCYEEDENSSNRIEVPNGTYNAYVDVVGNEITRGWGNRVANLIIMKSGYAPETYKAHQVIDATFEVGVDSGQAGVFDASKVHLTNSEDYDSWCSLSSSKNHSGVMSYGAVSSSGYGDGGYRCCILKNSSGVVEGIVVVFIEEETEEDSDDYEEFNEEEFHNAVYDGLTED